MALPRAQAAAVLISVAGIGISIYLTAVHFAGVVAACPASGAINCEAVLASPYAVLAGSSVPTSALGIAWFAVSAAVWTRPSGWVQVAWSAVGLVGVLGLVFVEIVLLGVICLWCTAAHALVLALMVIAVAART
ncbi:MAG: hypothetical protein E6I92_11305 [Chloroflexi bacterium]|nr:MAG: hypothetical protein E6I92_11305 [Chloroflexota bacterium]